MPGIAPDNKFLVRYKSSLSAVEQRSILRAAAQRSIATGKRAIIQRGTWAPDASMVEFASNGFVQIEGEGDGATIFKIDAFAPTVSFVYVTGGIQTTGIPTLTADVPQGSEVLPMTSTAGLAAGDIIIIHDPSKPIFNLNDPAGSPVAYDGQHVQIKHIGVKTTYNGAATDTGTKITLAGKTHFDYAAGTRVRKNTARQGPVLRNFTILRETPDLSETVGGRPGPAITLFRVKDTVIEGVKGIGMDSSLIRVAMGFGGKISDIDGYDFAGQSDNAAPYLIHFVEGTTGFRVNGAMLRGGRHLFTGQGDGSGIETHDNIFDNLIATQCAFAGVDTHAGTRHCTFNGIQTYSVGARINSVYIGNGIQDRGRFNVWNNPLVVGADVGAVLTQSYNSTLNGGTFDQCRVGIAINSAQQCRVTGHVTIRNPREDAITIRKTASYSVPMDDLRITAQIDVEGDPSGYVVNLIGTTWQDDWARLERIYAPDATRKFNGVPTHAYGDADMPSAFNFQNFDIGSNSQNALTTLPDGTLKMTAIKLPKGELVTKLGIFAGAVAATQTNFWMALYDRDRRLLGITNDLGTTSPVANAHTQLNVTSYGITTPAPSAAGTNYRVGDILVLSGGTTGFPARVRVTKIVGDVTLGPIETVAVVRPGIYGSTTAFPSSPANVTGGHGTGATIAFSTVATTLRTPYDGLYYIGVMNAAATRITVLGRTGQINLNGLTPIRNGTVGSGLTNPASAPNQAGALTAALNQPYHTVA